MFIDSMRSAAFQINLKNENHSTFAKSTSKISSVSAYSENRDIYFLRKKPEIIHLKWFIQQTVLSLIDWAGFVSFNFTSPLHLYSA